MKSILAALLSLGLALAALMLVAGCVTVHTGQSFDTSKVERLTVGATTKSQAAQLFGAPTVTIDVSTWMHPRVHFGDEDTAVIWRYVKGYGNLFWSSGRFLQLEFDAAGLLRDYYVHSDFNSDATPDQIVEMDFDLFQARQGIHIGQSTRTDVALLIGTNYVVLPPKHPGIVERWHYGFSRESKTNKTVMMGQGINQFHGKSLDVDFDAVGKVRHVQGESDFPEDVARERSGTP